MINPIEPFFPISKPEQSKWGNKLVCSWICNFSAPSLLLAAWSLASLILTPQRGAAPPTSHRSGCRDQERGWEVGIWLLSALCEQSQLIPRERSWHEETLGCPRGGGAGWGVGHAPGDSVRCSGVRSACSPERCREAWFLDFPRSRRPRTGRCSSVSKMAPLDLEG